MANMHLITGYANKEHIKSADQGSFNAALFGEGEFVLERGSKFAATIISNNIVRIKDGDIIMQGRHGKIDQGNYVDIDIDNGQQGYSRNDLIVVRYTKDSSTGIEEFNLVVLKGTPTTAEPLDPEYKKGIILDGASSINEMPLYRVALDGLNIVDLVCLFEVLPSWKTLKAQSVEETQNELEKMVQQAVGKIGDIKESQIFDRTTGETGKWNNIIEGTNELQGQIGDIRNLNSDISGKAKSESKEVYTTEGTEYDFSEGTPIASGTGRNNALTAALNSIAEQRDSSRLEAWTLGVTPAAVQTSSQDNLPWCGIYSANIGSYITNCTSGNKFIGARLSKAGDKLAIISTNPFKYSISAISFKLQVDNNYNNWTIKVSTADDIEGTKNVTVIYEGTLSADIGINANKQWLLCNLQRNMIASNNGGYLRIEFTCSGSNQRWIGVDDLTIEQHYKFTPAADYSNVNLIDALNSIYKKIPAIPNYSENWETVFEDTIEERLENFDVDLHNKKYKRLYIRIEQKGDIREFKGRVNLSFYQPGVPGSTVMLYSSRAILPNTSEKFTLTFLVDIYGIFAKVYRVMSKYRYEKPNEYEELSYTAGLEEYSMAETLGVRIRNGYISGKLSFEYIVDYDEYNILPGSSIEIYGVKYTE